MPEDKKSELDDFMQGLNKPAEDPFKSADPFAPKEEEEKPVVEEDSVEEKPLPFHKDPKVQKYVEKQIEKALKNTATSTTTTTVSVGEQDEMTDVLTRVIGNDTPEKLQGIKDMRRVLGSLEEKGAARALQQIQEQANKEAQEVQTLRDELESSFEDIESTYGVDLTSGTAQAKKLDEDFRNYIRKISHKNQDGEVDMFPDLVSAFEEFQDKSKRTTPTASRAKELASRGMSRSNDATAAPKVGNSWKDVEKLFSKLSN